MPTPTTLKCRHDECQWPLCWERKKLRGPRNSRMSGHIKYLVEEKGWAGVGWCFSRSRGRRFRYSSEAKSEWSNKWREREGVRGRLPVLRIREPPPPRMNRFVVKRFRWRRNVAADRIDPVIKSEGKKYFFVVFDCAEFLGTDLYRRLRSSLLAPERKPKAGRYGDEK